MAKDIIQEGILLESVETYTITELCTICVIDEQVIIEMVEQGILAPKQKETQWLFHYEALPRVQTALRLQQDLAINWAGISLVLDLLDEVKELRQLVKLHQEGKN